MPFGLDRIQWWIEKKFMKRKRKRPNKKVRTAKQKKE